MHQTENRQILRNFRQNRCDVTLQLYLHAKEAFKKHCNKAKNTFYQKELYDLVEKSHDAKAFWSKLKVMTQWGTHKQETIEAIHNYACKCYMCVKQKSTNCAVLGDCGRYPIYISAAKRCIKY